MGNTLITGLAVAGVIAAGAAAAAVNTTIFAGGDGSSESAAAAIVTPGTADSVPTAETTGATTPGTASSTSPPVASSPVEAAESGATEFRVGGAGTVTVATTDGLLAIVDAAPQAGWTVVETEEDAGEIEVVFRSPDTTVEFEAELVDGGIGTSIDAWATGVEYADHEEHEEHEEHDEYEDEEEEEEEEEDD